MKAVVVGAGSWGSAFSALLRDQGHEVTLAARDPAQAEAIRETGRNPRYVPLADLRGVSATTIAELRGILGAMFPDLPDEPTVGGGSGLILGPAIGSGGGGETGGGGSPPGTAGSAGAARRRR